MENHLQDNASAYRESKKKNSFKQSKNEVCADCLDNSINLQSKHHLYCRCICELYRGRLPLFGSHLKIYDRRNITENKIENNVLYLGDLL